MEPQSKGLKGRAPPAVALLVGLMLGLRRLLLILTLLLRLLLWLLSFRVRRSLLSLLLQVAGLLRLFRSLVGSVSLLR